MQFPTSIARALRRTLTVSAAATAGVVLAAGPAGADDGIVIGVGRHAAPVGSMTVERTDDEPGETDTVVVSYRTDEDYTETHLCVSDEAFEERIAPGRCDHHQSGPATSGTYTLTVPDGAEVHLQLHVVTQGETAYAGHQPGEPFYGEVPVPDSSGPGADTDTDTDTGTDTGTGTGVQPGGDEESGGSEAPEEGTDGSEGPGQPGGAASEDSQDADVGSGATDPVTCDDDQALADDGASCIDQEGETSETAAEAQETAETEELAPADTPGPTAPSMTSETPESSGDDRPIDTDEVARPDDGTADAEVKGSTTERLGATAATGAAIQAVAATTPTSAALDADATSTPMASLPVTGAHTPLLTGIGLALLVAGAAARRMARGAFAQH